MLRKFCRWWLIWYFLFFCHGGTEGQLQWVVKEKATAYGQNLTLFCPIENCCIEPGGWSVGPKAIILDVKTFSNDPKVKYHGTYNKDGFGVVIRNLSEADLNVTYHCVYGFDQSTPKYLLHGDVFRENVPDKDKEIDIAANVVPIVVIMVAIGFIIGMAYCAYRSRIKKKRQKQTGTDEEMAVLNRPDIQMENQQAQPSAQVEPVSGTSGVGPTTFQQDQSVKNKPMKSNNENGGNVSTIPQESDETQQPAQVEPVSGTSGVGPTTFQQDQRVKKKPMKSNNENEEDVSAIPQEIDENDISPPSQFLRLKDQLYQWVDDTSALVVDLEKLADNLDEHFKNISKAKVGGATGAVVGGLLAAAGFGFSFVTFGASLGLAVAGGVIGGSGGVVVSGSQITDAVLSSNSRSSAENILQKYISRVELLMKDCVEIGTLLKDCGNVDETFPLWVSFWGNLLFPSGSGIKRIGWDMIWKIASSAMKLSSFADDAVKTGAAVTTTAFNTIGSTTGKVFHVTGGVIGIMFLPFDIYILIDSLIDVHNDNSHKTSTTIRAMAAKMTSERPTKADIDRMVTEIVTNYTDTLTKRRLES